MKEKLIAFCIEIMCVSVVWIIWSILLQDDHSAIFLSAAASRVHVLKAVGEAERLVARLELWANRMAGGDEAGGVVELL